MLKEWLHISGFKTTRLNQEVVSLALYKDGKQPCKVRSIQHLEKSLIPFLFRFFLRVDIYYHFLIYLG